MSAVKFHKKIPIGPEAGMSLLGEIHALRSKLERLEVKAERFFLHNAAFALPIQKRDRVEETIIRDADYYRIEQQLRGNKEYASNACANQ